MNAACVSTCSKTVSFERKLPFGASSSMDTLVSLLGRNGFLPHGYCFTWTPGLLWAMVSSDAVIAASYFSIPVALLSYVRRRPKSDMNWLAWLFSAFIFACGITHLMDIWTIWQPDYGCAGPDQGRHRCHLPHHRGRAVATDPPGLEDPVRAAVAGGHLRARGRGGPPPQCGRPAGRDPAEPGRHPGQHRCRVHRHRPRWAGDPHERGGRGRDRLDPARTRWARACGRSLPARIGQPTNWTRTRWS